MELKVVLPIISLVVTLGIVHWGLVRIALEDLVARDRVIGDRNALWVLAILFVNCLGSLVYLIVHPELESKQAEVAGTNRIYRIRWDK